MPVENNEGEAYCLILSQFCLGQSFVFNKIVNGVEDDVNWLVWVVDHFLDSGRLVVKFLRGDAYIVVVEEIKYGRDKWCNLSGDAVAKGREIFGVSCLNDLLDEGLFEK